MSQTKRGLGQYFTKRNPFDHPAFIDWADAADLSRLGFLEPFAGSGNILDMLLDLDLVTSAVGYDIEPAAPWVQKRDTLADFPAGHNAVVTNPPYLARNSATRRQIAYPTTVFPDLYLHAMDVCLRSVPYVAAIIPESFITSPHLKARLWDVISLPYADMFDDTEHPVCLAMFRREPRVGGPVVWSGPTLIGRHEEIMTAAFRPSGSVAMRFNDPRGVLGLHAVDSQAGPTIRFLRGEEIDPSCIKQSSRAITRIGVDAKVAPRLDEVISAANRLLAGRRSATLDVGMTSFKGVRRDGLFRRRLDFAEARGLIEAAVADVAGASSDRRPWDVASCSRNHAGPLPRAGSKSWLRPH